MPLRGAFAPRLCIPQGPYAAAAQRQHIAVEGVADTDHLRNSSLFREFKATRLPCGPRSDRRLRVGTGREVHASLSCPSVLGH